MKAAGRPDDDDDDDGHFDASSLVIHPCPGVCFGACLPFPLSGAYYYYATPTSGSRLR